MFLIFLLYFIVTPIRGENVNSISLHGRSIPNQKVFPTPVENEGKINKPMMSNSIKKNMIYHLVSMTF